MPTCGDAMVAEGLDRRRRAHAAGWSIRVAWCRPAAATSATTSAPMPTRTSVASFARRRAQPAADGDHRRGSRRPVPSPRSVRRDGGDQRAAISSPVNRPSKWSARPSRLPLERRPGAVRVGSRSGRSCWTGPPSATAGNQLVHLPRRRPGCDATRHANVTDEDVHGGRARAVRAGVARGPGAGSLYPPLARVREVSAHIAVRGESRSTGTGRRAAAAGSAGPCAGFRCKSRCHAGPITQQSGDDAVHPLHAGL